MRIEKRLIENFEDYTDFTVLGDDTTNLAASAASWFGTYSLEFDKADGAANTAIAGAYKTTSIDLGHEDICPWDYLVWECYVSAVTDVVDCYVRLGTDASHNLKFVFADSNMAAGWNYCYAPLGKAVLTGNGWNMNSITYLEVGVDFDAQDDTLADIKFDAVYIARKEVV